MNRLKPKWHHIFYVVILALTGAALVDVATHPFHPLRLVPFLFLITAIAIVFMPVRMLRHFGIFRWVEDMYWGSQWLQRIAFILLGEEAYDADLLDYLKDRATRVGIN